MLNTKDIQKIKNIKNATKINLSIGTYYVKNVSLEQGINEIIGMHLAEILGLNCTKYDLFKFENNYFLLSKDLNNLGDFKIASDYNITKNTLYNIWESLKSNINNIDEVMYDIVKMYIFDLLFMIPDRHTDNYGFITKDNKTSLYILDNEYILLSEIPHMITSYYERENGMSYLEEIRIFLSSSSKEFGELFTNMLKKVPPEVLEQIITIIETEYNLFIEDKDKLLLKYTNRYNIIEKFLKGYSYGR